MTIGVLFVCAGNICRSPMAEAIFAEQVRQAGLSAHIHTDSAGTGSWHIGESAHPRTLAILRREGIAYDGRARQITPQDTQRFTVVAAMDRENLRGVQAIHRSGGAHVGLLLRDAFSAGMVDTDEVPDPYHSGVYERVFALVQPGAAALLARIVREHGLQPG